MQLSGCSLKKHRPTCVTGHVNKNKFQKDFGSGWGGSSVQLEIIKNWKTCFYTLFYYVFGRAFESQQRYKCAAMPLLYIEAISFYVQVFVVIYF